MSPIDICETRVSSTFCTTLATARTKKIAMTASPTQTSASELPPTKTSSNIGFIM